MSNRSLKSYRVKQSKIHLGLKRIVLYNAETLKTFVNLNRHALFKVRYI